jgi:hypothetical protein
MRGNKKETKCARIGGIFRYFQKFSHPFKYFRFFCMFSHVVGVGFSMVLQWCYYGVTMASQWCYGGVTVV